MTPSSYSAGGRARNGSRQYLKKKENNLPLPAVKPTRVDLIAFAIAFSGESLRLPEMKSSNPAADAYTSEWGASPYASHFMDSSLSHLMLVD